jgi:flagellar biosynthetic protein FliR
MRSYILSAETFALFTLALARIGGLVSFAPLLGSSAVLPHLRVALALGLTWVLFPVVGDRLGEIPPSGVAFFLLLVRELLIGFMLGFCSKLLFACLEMAGSIIGFQMGFSFIQIVDPQTQVESPFMGIFLNLVGTMLFLAFNGHHWLIQAVAYSYELQAGRLVSGALVEQMTRSLAQMFIVGFKIAAPLAVAMFLVDVLFGILGRAAPQLQLLVLGLPAKGLVGFALLAATVYGLVPLIGRHLAGVESELTAWLGLLKG